MRNYQELFDTKRLKIRERLQKQFKQLGNKFAVGDFVRVYRPTLSKASTVWSQPRKIVDAPTPSTRIVLGENNVETLEHVMNLMPIRQS